MIGDLLLQNDGLMKKLKVIYSPHAIIINVCLYYL